jgi:predicted AAA+ superfamily ATPase
MAISNRDRVARAFDLFVEGAEPFVNHHMTASMPPDTPVHWTEVVARQDEQRFGTKRDIHQGDPQVIIRMLLENWQVFAKLLTRSDRNLAGLLKDARNKLAHNQPFTGDETYRTLDHIEILLTAMGAVERAEAVRRSKVEHQRAVFAEEARRSVKTSAAHAVDGLGLKPWREVVVPHEDVCEGNFHAAEYAADLYHVVHGESSADEYGDPVEFFRRTYLTEGLKDLLSRAVRRASGDRNASPVVNLQTNFGGGKTHSMLALYHIFSGTPLTSYPQDVQMLLADSDLVALGEQVRRVVLVGNHLPAHGHEARADRPRINTIWGELAWQLGGADAFAYVAASDTDRTNPGPGLTELLRAHAPCVILIDEWVAYARQLYDRDGLAGGTFETQFTFAQTLTEAVKNVPGAMLVVSIPASDSPEIGGSDLEVGGANGQKALERLQHVVRRVADHWRPASPTESFEIVRRRLFTAPTGDALRDIAAIAHRFVTFYHQHKGEFPTGCSDREYEERIKAAYPLHPELFDRLYNDWSTLDRFQRTRGVLRLMSKVVHTLWKSNDASPLIMPATMPLDTGPTRNELADYLEDNWKVIIDKDVDGDDSTPVSIDSSRGVFGQRVLTRRLARTIFMGSAATLRSAHKGIDQQRIWLGAAVPGDQVGNFGSALAVLGDRATYLYAEGGRWWYDTQESVSRTAKDLADRLRDRPEDVWAEIVGRLRREEARHPGQFVKVHTAPDSDGEIPDDPEVRLVIIHPEYPHAKSDTDSKAFAFARRCLDYRGSAQRTHRNMLIFLAADSKRLEELEDAARQFLAWKQIVDSKVERNLNPAQAKQADTRFSDADRAVRLRIPETWTWALVPVQPVPDRPVGWATVRADGSEARLAVRTSAKLTQQALLQTVQGVNNLRRNLDNELKTAWESGHISAGDLWALHSRYPYLPRLKDWTVLAAAVGSAMDEITWSVSAFALATSYDEATGRYEGLAIPHTDSFGPIVTSTLLVLPSVALAQRSAEERDRAVAHPSADEQTESGVTGAATTGQAAAASPGTVTAASPAAQPNRFFGVYQVDATQLLRDLPKLNKEVLAHLIADDIELKITVEIEAVRKRGFTDDQVRTVGENARALKFDEADFEVDP